MLTGTRTLAKELHTYTNQWMGEELLFYSMKEIVVDGIHSRYYNPDGGGEVHFAPMISWKEVHRGGDEQFTCVNSGGPISEECWLKYGLIVSEKEYDSKSPEYWERFIDIEDA